MCRVLVFAIAVIAGFSLAGCGLDSGQSGSAIPLAGPETVGDAAATIAHRPTDSQNTAAAIDAVGVLGSRLNALAESAGDPDDLSGGAICRDGTEFFAPARRIGGALTETRAFYDPACTQLARDAIRVVTSRGPATRPSSAASCSTHPDAACRLACAGKHRQSPTRASDAGAFP